MHTHDVYIYIYTYTYLVCICKDTEIIFACNKPGLSRMNGVVNTSTCAVPLQLSPMVKTKRASTGKAAPPLGPETKVLVVWVERFDDIGKKPPPLPPVLE